MKREETFKEWNIFNAVLIYMQILNTMKYTEVWGSQALFKINPVWLKVLITLVF
jgi:hypothetical protein